MLCHVLFQAGLQRRSVLHLSLEVVRACPWTLVEVKNGWVTGPGTCPLNFSHERN